MRRFPLVLAASLLAAAPALAQPAMPYSSIRAINLARNTAVKLNQGLSVYRPAQCMFATSEPDNPCLIANDSSGYTFRFQGGPPGWQELNKSPTLETEIRIAPNGRSVEKVIYNGPVR